MLQPLQRHTPVTLSSASGTATPTRISSPRFQTALLKFAKLVSQLVLGSWRPVGASAVGRGSQPEPMRRAQWCCPTAPGASPPLAL